MKFNGATFNKAQQDQLKKKVGTELEDLIKKVEPIKYELDLSTSEGRNTLVALSQVAKQGKRVVLIDDEDYIYTINKVTNFRAYFERTTVNVFGGDYTANEIYVANVIVSSSVAKRVALSIKNDGTFGNWGTDLGNVTVFIGG